MRKNDNAVMWGFIIFLLVALSFTLLGIKSISDRVKVLEDTVKEQQDINTSATRLLEEELAKAQEDILTQQDILNTIL